MSRDGIGTDVGQRHRGSPGRVAHPAAHLHRVEGDKREVGCVAVDIDHILRPGFGQWDGKPYRSVSKHSKHRRPAAPVDWTDRALLSTRHRP
ncbi:hypothetical protein ACQI4L_05305 [Mycolicibacterium litorale]|uniref:hypothetical protein n=1 Tax=Mycolicibacterium litorale TaxID=758802 RepID=UPI003CEFBE9F